MEKIIVDDKLISDWINGSDNKNTSNENSTLSDWLKESLRPSKDPDKVLAEEVENIFGKKALRMSKREMQDILVKSRKNHPKEHKEPISKEETDELFQSMMNSIGKEKPKINFRPWG